MDNVKIIVLMGLPASGKSTFANEYKKKNPGTIILDYDKKAVCHFTTEKLICRTSSIWDVSRTKIIIMDGLFLNSETVISEVKELFPFLGPERIDGLSIEIHYWLENRDYCVKNDGGRRESSSYGTIMTAKYAYPDKNKIKKELNEFLVDYDGEVKSIKTISHHVELKPEWQRFYKSNLVSDDKYMYSPRWSTGGAVGNCWDSYLTPVSAEEPLEFSELDEFLESISPDISFLVYKRIRKECVSIEDIREPDYYGGAYYYQRWKCDKEKLFKILKENGIVK